MSDIVANEPSVERESIHKHQLKLSLVGLLVTAVLASLVLVAIAYLMYLRNPDRKFDLARPGSPNNNAVVSIESDDSDVDSPVDAQSAKQKLDTLDREIKALSGFGTFSAQDVSDQSLNLQPSDQPSL